MYSIQVTNPMPAGYFDLMRHEQAIQDASDREAARRMEIDERLEDDELVELASEAMGELFNTAESSERMNKVMNELAKACVLHGQYRRQAAERILSYIELEDERQISAYIYQRA